MAVEGVSGAGSKFVKENVSKWDSAIDSITPLSDIERDCVLELSSTVIHRPIPTNLVDEDADTVRIILPNVKSQQKSDLLDSLCSESITNTQQFYSWFCEIEGQMEAEDESGYTRYISDLNGFQEKCDSLLAEVSGSLDELSDLQSKHEFVSTKTNSLHQSCEHLLDEQTKLLNATEAITTKLSYFNELERINTKLGAQSLTVTSEGFLPMLSRIDECIAYIQSNPRYKDSALYLTKFHQSLSRALSLIKTHVASLLNAATQNLQPEKGATVVGDDTFTLFYGKFRANAPRVKSLIEQIERRTDKNISYKQLLIDCHQCYVEQRELLVEPSVSAAVTDLTIKHKSDHCALMRSGCALMVHICEDEYKLHQHFFNRPAPLLDDFLERLCNYLYDAFRPLIISINHMETLSELCTILKVEMLEDHVYNNPQPLRSFEKVCLQMLQDVQERLVYRTYIYINSDILNYKPGAGDLAYPDKLHMMLTIAEGIRNSSVKKTLTSSSSLSSSTQSLESQEVEAIVSGSMRDSAASNGSTSLHVPSNSSMPMSPADLHGMWYPTVRKTLICLSKLSRCIDTTTFQGLSQEALSVCIKSLLLARGLIKSNKTELDAQLFYIKHLLIIREQITPFQAPFSVRETQLAFSHIKDAALGLVKRSKDLFKFNSNNALLQFLFDGTPQALEYFMDSKQEVDQQLKISCSEFIDLVANQLLTSLNDFLNKVEVIRKMDSNGSKAMLTNQPFSKPDAVKDLVSESYRILKTKIPSIHQSMSLYLANRETEAILFKPIKAKVVGNWEKLIALVDELYSEEEKQIVACPSMEQVLLVLSK